MKFIQLFEAKVLNYCEGLKPVEVKLSVGFTGVRAQTRLQARVSANKYKKVTLNCCRNNSAVNETIMEHALHLTREPAQV